LWSFPEIENYQKITAVVADKFGVVAEANIVLPTLIHTFTHFKLHIRPQIFNVIKQNHQVNQLEHIWISIDDAIGAAIPTPIRKILLSMQNPSI
jgi:A/G-specific adenine glycosylase